jgi:16S rRNA (cytosine967-C5)-methyltransferase
VPAETPDATAARRAALRTLDACGEGRIFEQALDDATRLLDPRDRRLAHELAAGVLRRQTSLDALLAPLVTRGWDSVPPPLRNILRLGAYQLTALDRIPPHAAVATSVTLAREVAGKSGAGFANAVLRRLARNPQLAQADEVNRIPSHPAWLLSRWETNFGSEDTDRLLAWNDRLPRLAVQPARDSLETLVERWRELGFQVEAAPFNAGYYVDARRPDQLEGFDDGAFLVQDPAQALVGRYAGLDRGVVYDACAAPGGKAGDRTRVRVQRLKENSARAGSGHEFPIVADAFHPPLRGVDAVLLDAPCLGTGTFARHPDARWRVSPEALENLVVQQQRLLQRAALLVKPGGMLVYATCSLEPEENECQVDGFLTSHPEFRREPNPEFPPELLSPRGDLTILPHRHQIDGAFAARLRRSGP